MPAWREMCPLRNGHSERGTTTRTVAHSRPGPVRYGHVGDPKVDPCESHGNVPAHGHPAGDDLQAAAELGHCSVHRAQRVEGGLPEDRPHGAPEAPEDARER